MASPDPQLSRARSFLFGAMTLVWFAEMLFHGVPAFSRVWGDWWQVAMPANPQLAAALPITWAIAAPCKGALGVMAVWGLVSKDSFARTVLFVSMALVPPLNLAFPLLQQGFLFGPTTVAATLSAILWISLLLFREPARPSAAASAAELPAPGRSAWERYQGLWFGAYSVVVTVMALLFLIRPLEALELALPCLSGVPGAGDEGLDGVIETNLVNGTHLAAVAIAAWSATVSWRKNAALRRAMLVAGTVHAGLFLVFPWRQIAADLGATCAAESLLVVFVPLFIGWLVCAAVELVRARPTPTASALRGVP